MHITANVKEESLIKSLTLTEGTSVIVQDNDKNLRRLEYINGTWTMTQDFEEEDRPLAASEEAAIRSTLTKETVLKFFVGYSDYSSASVPYKVWRVHNFEEAKLFEYVKHDGGRYYDSRQKVINTFRVTLPSLKNSFNVDLFKDELFNCYEAVKAHYTDWPEDYIIFGIFEHTLSEGGIYELHMYNKNEYAITITTYGSQQELTSKLDFNQMVDYIRTNCYYD